MITKFATFIMCLGMIIMTAAFPVSLYVNGPEIWTEAGQLAGNKCMVWGGFTVLAGAVAFLVAMLFDD